MQNKKILKILTLIFCLYMIVTTTKAIFDLWKAGDKLTEREFRVATLEREKEDLLRQKARVENKNYWEKVARDKIGLSKPNEQILIIPQELLKDYAPEATPAAVPTWQQWLRLIL